MELFDALHTRRSIRAFAPGEVSEADLETMLGAAMTAPSAGNARPWRFIVIRDRDMLQEIAAINPYAPMAPKAALAVLVCGDTRLEKYPGYWVQDCAAATQNLLLAAHGLGYGAVWTGIHPMQERVEGFRRLCNLPEEVVPLALVPIGRPGSEAKYKNRYEADKVAADRW